VTAPVESAKTGSVGRLVLRSPSTLNALTLEMVEILRRELENFARDPAVRIVLLEGEGEKAFCAGGDVRRVTLSRKSDPDHALRFFSTEYRVDHAIHRFPKPVVVIGHGIVMGGGLGLLAGASHWVATETTVIAMPELAIGLFPDVGGGYFLNRLKDGLGLFLALTGTRLGVGDALRAGFVNQVVPGSEREAVSRALLAREWSEDPEEAGRELDVFFAPYEPRVRGAAPDAFASEVGSRGKEIARISGAGGIGDVARELGNAARSKDEWIAKAARGFLAGSPTSAAVIHEQLRRAKGLSLEDCLRMELGLAIRCCEGHDFPEGVRARLIDKDQKPAWDPPSQEAVTPELVAGHFVPPWTESSHPLRDLAPGT
jgi:enoyl-CoA hydratase/carnithine racemase